MKLGSLLIAAFLFASAPARADEILLKSGKRMTGRITAETAKSYTIKLAANMYLSIAKDDVAKVTRAKPAPAPASTRWIAPKVETSTAAVSASTAAAAANAATPAVAAPPTPAPVAVKNAREVTTTETVKVGAIRLDKTTRFAGYPITGADFAAAKKAVVDPAAGKGIKEGRKRSPSKTEWTAAWTGGPGNGGKAWKSMVVTATVTVTLPAWQTRGDVAAADAEKWSAYLNEATDHEMGHLEIIHDALVSFAESASNLSDASESELRSETASLFSAIKDQAVKRRQGYERRERRRPLPIKKK